MVLSASTVMSAPVTCAHDTMTVVELLTLLDEKQISGVPVVDADERLVGVISITDLVALAGGCGELVESDFHTSPAMDNLAASGGLLRPPEEDRDRPIAEIMSRHVITARATDSIGKLADLMVTHRVHRLIIVEDEHLAGIVSVRDILGALRDQYRDES